MYPDIGDSIVVVEGDYKDQVGKVVDEYNGWNFIQYTVLLNGEEVLFYHNEIKKV